MIWPSMAPATCVSDPTMTASYGQLAGDDHGLFARFVDDHLQA